MNELWRKNISFYHIMEVCDKCNQSLKVKKVRKPHPLKGTPEMKAKMAAIRAKIASKKKVEE